MNEILLAGTKENQVSCHYRLPGVRRHSGDLDFKYTLMSLFSYLLLLVLLVDLFFQSTGQTNPKYSLVIVSVFWWSTMQSALYKLQYQWESLLKSRLTERMRLLDEVREAKFDCTLSYACVFIGVACQVVCLTTCILALFSGFGAAMSIGVVFGVASIVQLIRYRQYLSKAIRAVFKVTVFELGEVTGETVAVIVHRDNGEKVSYPLPPRLSRRLWKKARVSPSNKVDYSVS